MITYYRFLILLALIFPNIQQTTDAEDKRPNILFFFTDDQRPDTIAALGNSVIQTPNLDQLVKRGLVFNNAYCMGSTRGAVCNPSRHQMLSGLSLFRYQKRTSHVGTFGDVFTKAGYVTYHQSKSRNVAKIFHKGFTHSSYLKDFVERKSGHHGRTAANHAISFMKKKWDRSKPMLMYIGFAGPHDPRVAADQWMKLYDREKIPLPKNFKPFHPLDNGALFIRDEKLAPWPRTDKIVRRHLHDYYACISSIDHHIGRVINTLKELKEYENTIIIFSSDHGLSIGSHGLFGKQNLYEHSMGAPLIFAGPGIPQGKTDAFAYLFDIFPTAADFANIKTPTDLDGKSLLPIIQGKSKSVRDTIFLAYKSEQRAVRQGRWKLYRFPKIDRNLLFDLESDPDELKNLEYDSNNTHKVQQMMSYLAKQQKMFDDPYPLNIKKTGRAEIDLQFYKDSTAKAKQRNRSKKKKQ